MDEVVFAGKQRFESLNVSLKHLNSSEKNIKFTIEFKENNKLSFLDSLLITRDNNLLFSIYNYVVGFSLGRIVFKSRTGKKCSTKKKDN